MNIVKSNTTFVFIYTISKKIENRFVEDIMYCLKQLQNIGLYNTVLLIDGYNESYIIEECKKHNLKLPIIKSFYSNYNETINSINTENIFITITGHSGESNFIATKDIKQTTPDYLYKPLEESNCIKNVFFIYGQCQSGFAYKYISNEMEKNYFIFGASDEGPSKSSIRFFYEIIKISGNKIFTKIYKQFKAENKINLNVFLVIFYSLLIEYINIELNIDNIKELYQKINESYIYETSMKNFKDIKYDTKLRRRGIKKISNKNLIKKYNLSITRSWELVNENNLPWLTIVTKETNEIIQNNYPTIYTQIKLGIALSYSKLCNYLNEQDSEQVKVDVKTLLKLYPDKIVNDFHKTMCYLTLSLTNADFEIKGKNENFIDDIIFSFKKPFIKNENFADEVISLIKDNNKNLNI